MPAPKARIFIDHELYLPQEWTEDRPRCQRQVSLNRLRLHQTTIGPADVATNSGLRVSVTLWVTGDEVYGSDDPLRQWLKANQQAYVLAVRRNGRVGFLSWHGRLWNLGGQ